jgi:SAM-dependent methyltransferase
MHRVHDVREEDDRVKVEFGIEMMQQYIAAYLEQHMPADQYRRLLQRARRLTHPAWLGTLRRTAPLSQSWGRDRGSPVDRFYIARFVEQHRRDIHGHVLEIRQNTYADRYGSEIRRCDVIDIDRANRRATIVADLTAADAIQPNQFDCFILTQMLQFVYDYQAVVAHAHRLLRPGGTLLATMPAISRIDRRLASDYWRFTVASCSALFGDIFGTEQIQVYSYGNVLAAIAFLAGMAQEELSYNELIAHDDHFPVIIAVRAIKKPES